MSISLISTYFISPWVQLPNISESSVHPIHFHICGEKKLYHFGTHTMCQCCYVAGKKSFIQRLTVANWKVDDGLKCYFTSRMLSLKMILAGRQTGFQLFGFFNNNFKIGLLRELLKLEIYRDICHLVSFLPFIGNAILKILCMWY